MTPHAFMVLGCGLIFLIVSLPLVYRKIPMNRIYGFRVKASFVSDDRWYDINAYSGRLLARYSLLPILAGTVGFFLPDDWFQTYSMASSAAIVLGAFIPILLTFRYIRRTYG